MREEMRGQDEVLELVQEEGREEGRRREERRAGALVHRRRPGCPSGRGIGNLRGRDGRVLWLPSKEGPQTEVLLKSDNTAERFDQHPTLTYSSNLSHLQRRQAELQAEQKRLLQAQRSLYGGRPLHLVLKVVFLPLLSLTRSNDLHFVSPVRAIP